MWSGFLLLALVIVIFWPAGSGKETASGETEVPEQTAQEIQSQEEAMEQALADTLAQVDGVGAVRVALTLESTNRKIVEKDVPDSQSSETRTSGDETSEKQLVFTGRVHSL